MSDEKDTANVISMAKHTNSAKHTSVVEMLKQAIDDIEKGVDGYHPNKAVLLLLDDKDGGYVDGFYNAGIYLGPYNPWNSQRLEVTCADPSIKSMFKGDEPNHAQAPVLNLQ